MESSIASSAYNMKDQQNLLYLYDLPKTVSSTKIAQKIKEKTGVELDIAPQIRRDFGRHFYTAMLKINDNEKFNKVAQEMKYVEFDNKPCRALKFDKEFLGGNRAKLSDKNVFVRKIPKDWKPVDLDREFSKYGPIKSLKISMDKDHNNNGYGFVCFEDPQSAQIAIESTKNNVEGIQAIKFAPRPKTEFQKIFNNIYVKNFPSEWQENELRNLFSPYGKVASVVVYKNESGAFGFVCYDKDQANGENAFSCAQNAVKGLNGKVLDGQENPLYVKAALNKEERQAEKEKEKLRYKNSKKRCNLYVKNFPPDTSEQQLREIFSPFGQIESIKLFKKDEEAVYAFVCYKSPEEASKAKASLNQTSINGKQIYINHYEIKEVRKAQYEEIHDRNDFSNYIKANTNVSNILGKPEILAIITQFINLIQPRLMQQMKQGHNKHPRGPGQRPPFQQRPGPMNPDGRQQVMMPPPQPVPIPGPGQQPMPNVMGPGMQPFPQQRPGQPVMGIPNMQMQPQPNIMIAPQYQQNAAYLQRCIPVIPSVHPNNPNYKAQVGEAIFEFVERIAGEDKAPKITGMLIDLPLEEIVGYLKDYSKLEEKVREAVNLLGGQ